MKITTKNTVKEVLTALSICRDDQVIDMLKELYTPVPVPSMTFGQRVDLSDIKVWKDIIFIPQMVFYRRGEGTVNDMPFMEVYTFGMSVLDELAKLAERDRKIFHYEPTIEEVKAGYLKLNHGIFGTVDTIARRMGIPEHDKVFNIPEIVVHNMLKIDFQNAMYQRTYNEVIQNKQ